MPEEIAGLLAEQTEGSAGPFAVRSSATAEDSEATAFAGVFHSELGVLRELLGEAVRTCLAESLTYEALAHALRSNIDPRRVRFAVVVQEMVAADNAGVLFTKDPSGARPEEAVLVVTEGIGEALMQGDVAGSSVRLRRDGRDLSDPLHRRLLDVGLRIEGSLGHPQDVEWSARGGEIYFLQTRPITGLEARSGPPILWSRELTEERYPEPISPLGWSSLQSVLRVTLDTLAKRFGLVARRPDEVARTIRHYVYANQKFFSIPGSLRPNPLAHLRFLPGYVRHFFGVFRHLPAALFRRGPFGVGWVFQSQLFRAAVVPHAREITNTWKAHLEGLLAEMESFDEIDPSRLSDEELFLHHRKIEGVAERYMEPDLAIYVVKMACSWFVERIGARLHGRKDPAFLTELTSALEDNRTLTMNREMEELAALFRADAKLVELMRDGKLDELRGCLSGKPGEAFAAFVKRNGHLTTNWDMKDPTWGEAPDKILQMLRGSVLAEERHSFQSVADARLQKYRAAKADALSRLEGSKWLIPFFEELLSTLHTFMSIDEEHHFYCSRLFPPMRRVYAEMGARLTARGVIESPEDLYFLELGEIVDAFREATFSRKLLIESRKASFLRSVASRPPHRFRDQAPIVEPAGPGDGSTVLRGVGASPGVVTGIARVVITPDHAGAFRSGEILVTPTPKPAWTSVYAVAAGLVTATGSMLSHGLVVAREYHLPAVIGIEDLTERISTGQKVTVDGDRGIVSFEARDVRGEE